MAKQRNDYENSWYPRLKRWLCAGSGRLGEDMARELEEDSQAHKQLTEADAAQREQAYEAHQQAVLAQEQGMYDKMHAWTRSRGMKIMRFLYSVAAVIICFSVIAVLLTTVSNLPRFGSGANPIHNEVSRRYIEKGVQETGAVNIVAGMILDYRAFDTLGESHVLFIAACSVMILLRLSSGKDEASARERLEAEARAVGEGVRVGRGPGGGGGQRPGLRAQERYHPAKGSGNAGAPDPAFRHLCGAQRPFVPRGRLLRRCHYGGGAHPVSQRLRLCQNRAVLYL